MRATPFALTFFLIFIGSVISGQTCPGLLGSQLSGESGFGRSVALSGDGMTLITGKPQSSNPGTASGGATVYEFDNGAWESIYYPFGFHDNGSNYGFDVGINGDGTRVILGGPQDPMPPPNGTHVGGARVYQKNGSSFSPLGGYLTGNTEFGRFGHAVDMNTAGDIIAVGQPGTDAQIGETSVYLWDGADWNQIGQAITGEAENDLSGYHVSLDGSGTTLAIAEPQFTTADGHDGRVRIFGLEGDNWVLQVEIPSAAEFVLPMLEEAETIQMELSDDGQHLVLGSPYFTEVSDLEYEGQVQIYGLENGSWVEDASILGYGNLLGASVTINADGSIITAADESAIHTFQKVDGTWVKMGNSLGSSGDNLAKTDASMDASGFVFAKSSAGNISSPISVYSWPCDEFAACAIPGSCNFNNLATVDDGSCDLNCLGCHDPTACNYDPTVEETLFGPSVVVDFDNCVSVPDIENSFGTPSCPDDWLGDYPITVGGTIVNLPFLCFMTSVPNVLHSTAATFSFPAPVTNLSFTYWTQSSWSNNSATDIVVTVTTEQGQTTYSSADTPWLFDAPNECPGSTFSVPDIGIVSLEISRTGSSNVDGIYVDDLTFTYGTGCQYNGCADPLACNYGNDCNGAPCDYTSCAGCTDDGACNYDALVTIDDGSCEYLTCAGCTAPSACNFDEAATIDDGTCEYITCAGCTAPSACNYDPTATIDDGSCLLPDGCTDEGACNYNSLALCNDGTCEYISCAGCMDPTACNYDPTALIEDVSCEFESCAGCTDSSACNYDSSATIDDESCAYTADLPSDVSLLENTLSAVYDPAFNYQWGECLPDDWTVLPGEVFSDFTPTFEGSYAVEIAIAEFPECWILTACTSVSISHLVPQEAPKSWKVWPNPTAGVLRIIPPTEATSYSITLRNQLGQVILNQKNMLGPMGLLTLDAPSGVYQLHIESEGAKVHSQTVVFE